jgi:copper(I)-binding protein
MTKVCPISTAYRIDCRYITKHARRVHMPRFQGSQQAIDTMEFIRAGVMCASFLFILAAGAMTSALAQARETYRAGPIVVETPWSRATPGGAKVAGGYMRITNTGSEPDRLVGGSTVVAERFEVHRSTVANGVARMEPVTGGLEIAPGHTVELKPGTMHAMFVGLKQGLKPGDTVRGMLVFEKAGVLKVEYQVGGIGAQAAPAAHQGH